MILLKGASNNINQPPKQDGDSLDEHGRCDHVIFDYVICQQMRNCVAEMISFGGGLLEITT